MASASSSTTRTYQEGDVVVDNCLPITKILSPYIMNKHCNNCFVTVNVNELTCCTSCDTMKYCQSTCKTEDWDNGHNMECKSPIFRNNCFINKDSSLDDAYDGALVENAHINLLTFRMYALLKQKPTVAKEKFALHDGTMRCLEDLLDADATQLKKESTLNLARKMTNDINSEAGVQEVTFPYILSIVSVVKKTFLPIYKGHDDNVHNIGWGVYIANSAIKHSCKPTAHFVYNGFEASLRVIGNIENGEVPRTRIVSGFANKSERRRQLMERGQVCNCELCECDEDSAPDFKQINMLHENMADIMESFGENTVDKTEWNKIYCMNEEFVALLRKTYHKYDKHITNQLMTTLGFGIFLQVSHKLLKKFTQSTREHVLITYGERSPIFKELQNLTSVAFDKDAHSPRNRSTKRSTFSRR